MGPGEIEIGYKVGADNAVHAFTWVEQTNNNYRIESNASRRDIEEYPISWVIASTPLFGGNVLVTSLF